MHDDGSTRRTHFVSAARQGDRAAAAALVAPPMPIDLQYLWGWFVSLSAGRASGFDGPAGLSWSDLANWGDLHRIRLKPFECEAIMRIDIAWRIARQG